MKGSSLYSGIYSGSLVAGVLIAATSILVAQVGEAAPSKKGTAKQRPTARVVKKVGTPKSVIAPAASAPLDETARVENAAIETLEASPASSMTTATASSADSAAPAATSKISTAEQIQAVKPRKFKAELYSYNNSPGANRIGDGAVTSINYVGLRYNLTDKHTISFRHQFGVDYGHENVDTKVSTADFMISSTRSDVVKFLGDGTVALTGRILLPTGDTTREQTKSNGTYFLRAIVTKPVSKRVTLDYWAYGSWVNNSQDTYFDSTGKKETANTDYALNHFGAVTVDLGNKISFVQALGTEHTWKRPMFGVGTTRNFTAYVDSALAYDPVAGTTFSLGVEQHANIINPQENYRLYRASDTQYYFALSTAI